MEKVYAFIQRFAEKEAEVATRKRVPDLDAYHKALQEYYTFLVEQLQGATGHMPLDGPRSEAEYAMLKSYPDDVPRRVFKISEYTSAAYGKAWVVFTSGINPGGKKSRLNSALIVIEENGVLKVAKLLLLTNYTENRDPNAAYRWDEMQGYTDLSFQSLEGPVSVERYLEPSDWEEGLSQYNADI
jgi:hypothetical protein